jgi:hypothetical protein
MSDNPVYASITFLLLGGLNLWLYCKNEKDPRDAQYSKNCKKIGVGLIALSALIFVLWLFGLQ